MCTSIIIKAQDGSPLYGRTMEWGAFDLQSELFLVPRGTQLASALSAEKTGITWKSRYGFLSINPAMFPQAVTDGINEAGLAVGALYMPGFAHFQEKKEGEEAISLSNVDFTAYILSQFDRVAEIKIALPRLRVVNNEDAAEAFGAPAPLHWVITDETGQSIVVEYVDGLLHLYDNQVGVMTNSPGYDWHLLNLRNYPLLQAQDVTAPREINGVSLAPFGVGSGMAGLPGDITPPSRFIRAVAYAHTLLPFAAAQSGVSQLIHVLHNFDIPIGLVREGEHEGQIITGQTQFTVIGDLKNRRYYYWTEQNSRMRLVDLRKLDFTGDQIQSIPLDDAKAEDIKDRTRDFISK